MTKVTVRENKKYIKTSRKKVSSIKENKVNITALAYHICRSKPKKTWSAKDVHYEMLKDGIQVDITNVINGLRILSGMHDTRVLPEFRRNELNISYTGNRQKALYKINPLGTVRVQPTKALRTVTYHNTSKAEFIQK